MAFFRDYFSTFFTIFGLLCITTTTTGNPQPQLRNELDASDPWCSFENENETVQIPVSLECNGLAGPLWQVDDQLEQNQQCRSFCTGFADPDFVVSRIPSNCGTCRRLETSFLYEVIFSNGNANFSIVCVPRGVCIDTCGEEPPGCVYSGTCESLICLQSKQNDPSRRLRVTHAGPRSVFEVQGELTKENGPVLPTSLEYGKICKYQGEDLFIDTVDRRCTAELGDQPLSDTSETSPTGQCRAYCDKFSAENYEILHVEVLCRFCEKEESDEFVVQQNARRHICIPREVCAEKCGEEPPGCVYSGSCQDLFCFSGIDSKRPATITTGKSGSPSFLKVDNHGPPISIDPPFFANQSKATPDPDANTESMKPSASPIASRSAAPTPSLNDNSQDADGTNQTQNDDNRAETKWVWLGPVLGLFGATLVSLGGIYAACILRGKAEKAEVDVHVDAWEELS